MISSREVVARFLVSPVTAEERERIVDALKAGQSQTSLAKEAGRGVGTINRIAQAEGLEYSAPRNAALAVSSYSLVERLKLLDKAFAKAAEILETCATPGHLWQWSTAFTVLTTTRRLEDGDATSRAEVIGGNDHRDRLASRLDELAERRATKVAS